MASGHRKGWSIKLDCRRIVIAGTQSGVGKTSITIALAFALRRRGLAVQTYKVGPDFLDPSYLAVASGRPCYNLDGWMMGRRYVERLFSRTSRSADICIVEGVMGMFDGADPAGSEGSTAEIARWLEAPVILIADAYGMARSFAAVIKGYAEFDPGVRLAGAIANRCGSPGHAGLLDTALRTSSLPPLVGGIPLNALPGLQSRHLGLVTADMEILPADTLSALADGLERHVSPDAVLELAATAPALPAVANEEVLPSTDLCIGIARDAAFHFYYQDLFDELERRGCTQIFFSPLADKRLPEGIDALYIGGGYPEELAAALAANREMIADVRRFSASGRPLYAECGGLMYLCRTLEDRSGARHSMAGLLPAETRMLDRIKRLGYVEAFMERDSLWGGKGASVRGHEFHYSELAGNSLESDEWLPAYSLNWRSGGRITREGFQRGLILASYTHLHLASHPEAIDHFLSVAAAAKQACVR